MRKINDVNLSSLRKRDGIRTDCVRVRLHPPVRQRAEEIVQQPELRARAFVPNGERVAVGRVYPIPNIAVSDRPVKAGRQIAASTDDAPGAPTHFVRVMDL